MQTIRNGSLISTAHWLLLLPLMYRNEGVFELKSKKRHHHHVLVVDSKRLWLSFLFPCIFCVCSSPVNFLHLKRLNRSKSNEFGGVFELHVHNILINAYAVWMRTICGDECDIFFLLFFRCFFYPHFAFLFYGYSAGFSLSLSPSPSWNKPSNLRL